MAVTTYGAHAPLYDAVAKIEKPAKKAGFWHGFWQAVVDARMRQAEREIARYLGGNGGKFTDEAEREIERRFLSNDQRL